MPVSESPAPAPLHSPARRRLGRRGELLLAILPVITVLGLLWLLKLLSNQQLLFASLASSCFLIYLDPGHPTNSARTLVISQLAGAILGFAFHAWLGPGYLGAALALLSVIGVMIAADAMHPPAVATALNFAFRAGTGEGNLLLFGLAVGLVLVLLAVQRGSAYVLGRLTRAVSPPSS